ncbi:MAG: bL17 family ribosomal protein, partial [Patescibacteria group bacterium]
MKRTLRAQADFQSTLLRNQLTSLVLYESVTTTKSKAKKLIAFANHFFNRVVPADLNSKRLAAATLFDKNAQEKVFEEILPRYGKTDTTFVRHFRVLPRKGDSAEMVMVSLIKTLQA